MVPRVLLLLALIAFAAPATAAPKLAPWKDKLFAYPPAMHIGKNNIFRMYAFDRKRDVLGRDRIPRRKVKREYVNENVRWSRSATEYSSQNGTFKLFTVGKTSGARVIVVYVHGKGGNHRQGVNDWTFGGNFNRLQNLMTRNNGLLLTPSFTGFTEKGTQDIAALMATYKARSPSATMIVACGSMGGGICWSLAKTPQTARLMDGMFLLGSHWSDAFLQSPTARPGGRPVPLYIGHGTDDVVFDPQKQLGFFNRLRSINPSYPARFVLFDKGVHGTPIRMVNWREELNWMLSLN